MESSSDTNRSPERRRVLEMLERRQISAAEADELMAALEGRAVDEDSPSSEPPSSSDDETASLWGPMAALAGVVRALAGATGQVSVALGRVISTLARLSLRVRHLWPADPRG